VGNAGVLVPRLVSCVMALLRCGGRGLVLLVSLDVWGAAGASLACDCGY
jgi:hypothetical protein